MTDSPPASLETARNILEYLKSLRFVPGAVEVRVRGGRRTGSMQVRQGQVFAAECGSLQGNGAFLTLVAMGEGEVSVGELVKPFERNVSVTVAQVEHFLAKLPNLFQAANYCDEERACREAIGLFYQFRRREATAKLVEVLRSNRFYYPAWLWHSRLMTREDHIKKALNEAGKWGNADPVIQREVQKITQQCTGSLETVRRCIFCWSLVGSGEECCHHCGGLQRVAKGAGTGRSATEELHQALSRYAEAMRQNPRNSRIAYCLCLGFCSLGQFDRARTCINAALKISPQEPLFVRAAALLREPVKKAPVHEHSAARVQPVVVVPEKIPAGQKIKVDKTVLVVEDSRTARKVISVVLGRKGYKILETASGTEALLAIEGVTPDLVLLDVMLPDMTGYEVLSAIRKNRELCRVPVVMLTGKRDAADRQKGMLSGASEYLTKPFDPVKLLGVLGKYLDSSMKTAAPRQASAAARPEPVPPAAQGAVMAQPTEIKAQPTMPTAAQPKKNGPDKSILVVEDSPTSRKVISMVLSRKGYVVEEAASGGEALRQVHDQPPHLILLDAMLPDMTGYDILARLQQDQRLKGIPVVMLTAKDSPIDREKGLRAGAVAYLTKPFNPDRLLSVIAGSLKTNELYKRSKNFSE